MKLTTEILKELIREELSRLDEVEQRPVLSGVPAVDLPEKSMVGKKNYIRIFKSRDGKTVPYDSISVEEVARYHDEKKHGSAGKEFRSGKMEGTFVYGNLGRGTFNIDMNSSFVGGEGYKLTMEDLMKIGIKAHSKTFQALNLRMEK